MTEYIENQLSFKHPPKVQLQVRDLSIAASKSNRVLLDYFSLDLPSGSVMAIMGGSGSGKTTLLNVLASKISGGLSYEGDIHYILEKDNSSEGETDVEDGKYNKLDASMTYLPQQDVLLPRLTCRETLMIAADLKLHCDKNEKTIIVNQLIDELGLKDCADTMVGDSTHRGLSGGEKRRLSIGTQMIANPSIMFLDEPTTGLDAYSAYLTIKTLKKLAQNGGRTFIMSIHQPRSDILFLLDYLCILSKGRVVFCDQMTNTIPYFEAQGYTVPKMTNPADYLIDISSVDTRNDASEKSTQLKVDKLIDNWKNFSNKSLTYPPISIEDEIKVHNMSASVSFWKQVLILTKRNYKLNISDYVSFAGTFLEPLLIGTAMGWIYYKPDKSSTRGLRTIAGFCYSCLMLQSYLYLLFDTYRLCELDIAIFDRERAEGTVHPVAFIFARKLSLFFTDDIIMSLLFSIITYFMVGFDASADSFFLYFAVVFLTQVCCSGLSMFSVAVSRDFSKASLVGNLSFTLLSLASGFFVNSKVTPVYVRWTKYISFSWYGYGTLLNNFFVDKYCTDSNDLETCTGNQIIEQYGFPRYWKKVPMSVLMCFAIGYFLASIIMLCIHKVDITLQNEIKSNKKNKKENKIEKLNVGLKEDFTDIEGTIKEQPLITVTIEDIDLQASFLRTLKKGTNKKLFYREQKEILHSINAVFKPNMINAIMGPSGSGKSSLLNLLSGRTRSSLFAKFSTTGSILFNDIPVTNEMFKSICSYVTQDDDHLLSSLTVKETFRFAADLRLHEIPVEERYERVDELIRQLGLKHCENTIIGNEFVKGISGGEKRRVTMGVQLLNDPPIILLDEPTSGLDSFTSANILEILQRLSTVYGKTIIFTIHQPRAELFVKFGNVLLLAKSGKTAFNGSPNEMIRFFSSLGYNCPELTNVADFFLDLISINTQNEQNELISRQRVEHIIDSWNNRLSEKVSPIVEVKEEISLSSFLSEYGDSVRKPCNLGTAYAVNLRRQWTTTWRNYESLSARVAQVPGIGVIFALFWSPIKHNYTSINDRMGLAQESTALYFCGMLGNLACYPLERDYFYVDYHDNVYGIAPFFLAYMTLELPLSGLAAIMYTAFTVMVCGLPRTAGNFFATAYCSFVVVLCGESLGIMTNTFFERPGFVVNCISIILSIGCQMAGLMSLSMSRVLKGFNYLNPLGYTSMILINFAFPKSLKLTCEDGGKNPDGTCIFSNGHDVLVAYNIVVNTKNYLAIIVCVAIIYRLLAYFTLKAKLEWIKW
ncbi:hypothetical protein TBLA_0F01040 [Henningerozyma blattae CBS 6284]|uniref:ABC transporter domain-containing protein n=1 Tax=Henningerozyma blattae (strain ATCC 34711 / CBS 6284 / DSM 70876 / NBRC 10599 / NRRL Y-10934 / UCD 77-7) TaxID=1071380 RepID=I2H5J5_HENB6|nr:hypothetical protein TBLA_0F01040 [Tetrapisispora blattae CBS 6284]CCH61647.1 hypothetical protein TBLA_0F01040 [Tetrapisispora blattae CBS 6284]